MTSTQILLAGFAAVGGLLALGAAAGAISFVASIASDFLRGYPLSIGDALSRLLLALFLTLATALALAFSVFMLEQANLW